MLLLLPEYQSQQGHSHKHAILHLSKISRSGITVDFGRNLIHARQWMEYHHIRRCLLHKIGIHHVRTLLLLLLHRTRKIIVRYVLATTAGSVLS